MKITKNDVSCVSRRHLVFEDLKAGDLFEIEYEDRLYLCVWSMITEEYMAADLQTGEAFQIDPSRRVKRLSKNCGITYTDADLEQWCDEAVF